MEFQSTRDINNNKYSAAQVIKQGLADDGGLFVPEAIPQVSLDEIRSFCNMGYPELAATVLGKFLSDYSREELLEDCKNAYSPLSFPNGACPLFEVDNTTYSLELWHGPTCAFKDMALQIMPRLLSRALIKTGEKRNALILVATSGDTGKAALEGYRDIPQIKISVFYPENGVSQIQKMQMTTQEGKNVNVCAVKGNFDDIQSTIKEIFSDVSFANKLNESGCFLSSANSINFGRLAPQISYYFKAYCDLLNNGKIALGNSINVCVPTGNFGNILAAYIAKLMGLPISKLICASNANNVLTDFLNTGRYDKNRGFYTTSSPSMDILISSNLERLLYFTAGIEKTSSWMQSLYCKGYYEIDAETKSKIDDSFIGYFANEERTSATIKKYYDRTGYLMDTHTAVAFSALDQYREAVDDQTPTVVASTASPYKFAKDVFLALGESSDADGFEIIEMLSKATKTAVPTPLSSLDKKAVRFERSVDPQNIINEVERFIK